MPRKTETSSLVEALKFISLAQRDNQNPLYKFCQLSGGFAASHDGILTAAHKIEEDLEARPHTQKLISALNNCGKNLSITQLESNNLVIKSGRYSAKVPCHDAEISAYLPDKSQFELSNIIRTGFDKIQHLTSDTGQTVYQSSILLQSGSMIATNAATAIEFWHGLNIPTLAVPKSFASAVCKIPKNIVSGGFTASTFTIWFNDESWLKTQLFADPWPDIAAALNMPALSILELPKNFYKGISAVEEFSEEGKEKGHVWISDKGISSHENIEEGAFFEMLELGNITVGIRQLKNIQSCCKQLAFGEDRIFFFGENTRGVVMGVKI